MKLLFHLIILIFSCFKLNAWNAPSISSPSNNAEVWVGVRLNWNSVVGSQRYEVQVDTSLQFNSPLLYSATNTYINSSSGNVDTQVDPPSLRFGTLYYWRVRAYVPGDTSSWNNSTFITRDFVNISSPSDGAEVWTGFTLNWDAHDGVNFYDVRVDTSLNFNTDALRTVSNTYINTSDGNNDTQWFINNLYFGSVYYWQVRARNSADSSEWTSPRTFQTRDFVTITSPSNEADVWTGLTLNWNAHDGVSFYDVRVDTSLNFNTDALRTVSNTYINTSDGNNDTQWFIDNLYFGHTYYWQVRARNAVDSSAWSEPLTFQTRDFVNKTSPNNTDTWTGLTINWAPHAGVDFYDMQVDTSSQFNSNELNTYTRSYINSTDGNNDTQVFVEDLLFGIRYYWRVRARNTVDSSAWGEPFFFNTRNFVNLTSPANANQNNSLNPTLNWAPHAGINQYHLQIDTTNLYNSDALVEVFENYINSTDGNSDTQEAFSGLSPNTIYFWRVRAINARDTSAWTERWFNTGMGSPVFPEIPLATSKFCSSLAPTNTPTLSWQSVVDADFYEIEINPSNEPLSSIPDETLIEGTTFTTAQLPENDSYCWTVRAVRDNIAGPWSTPCCFSIPGEPNISQAFLFQESYCEGDIINLNAAIEGLFLPENEFKIQLSDFSGSFDSAIDLLTFTNISDEYVVELPQSLTEASYRIRIISTSPALEGIPSDPFLVSNTPELQGELNALTCIQLPSIELSEILPAGGEYSGDFVSGNMFLPSEAGIGSFEVFYTYSNNQGCSATTSGFITVDACTSSEDELQLIQKNKLIQVQSSKGYPFKFILYDLSGRSVYEITSSGLEDSISLKDMPPGIYLYTISSNGSTQNGKFPIH